MSPCFIDICQVGRGLCILEESSVTIERRRKFLELCRNMFYVRFVVLLFVEVDMWHYVHVWMLLFFVVITRVANRKHL